MKKSCLACLLFCAASQASHAAAVGGTLTSDTVWSPALGTIMVVSNVVVPASITLTIEASTTVQLTNGVSIQVQNGGTIDIEGNSSNIVHLVPMVGNNNWGTINSSGASSHLTVRFAELARGGISFSSGASGLIEDSYLHDYGSEIVGNSAGLITMRRIHVNNYSETIFNSGTVVLAEDSLFENILIASGDAFEIQNGIPGSIIRRCTFRHGIQSNTDALDFNGSTGVFVHDCLIYDFNDKGVSIGTANTATDPPARGIIVSNCFIYKVDSGLAVKDFSTASLYDSTIVNCPWGVRAYEKYSPYNLTTGGGRFTNGYNNVIWANTNLINPLTNGSVMDFTYSDLQSVWPGTGNIHADPLFINLTQLDCRLASGSPARGTGYLGRDMGANFPVGAPMASSHPQIQSVSLAGGTVKLRFWMDEGKPYHLQKALSVEGTWADVAPGFPSQPLPVLMETSDLMTSNARFYRLVTP
jgi:hypothetical protein